MDYTKKLKRLEKEKEDLITKAKSEGYVVFGTTAVKDEYVPVIEGYIRGQSTYESSGHYAFAHATSMITQNIFDEIKNIKEEDLWNSFVCDILNDCQEFDSFNDILDFGSNHYEDLIKKVLTPEDMTEHYWKLNGDENNSAVEIQLGYSYGECDQFLDGYISVYKMKISDIKNIENKKSTIEKYLKAN